MRVKDAKELLSSLSDDEPIWFWITTKEEMDERAESRHGENTALTKEEYERFIQLLEVDDGLVEECFRSEDYLLDKIIEKRNTQTEGNK